MNFFVLLYFVSFEGSTSSILLSAGQVSFSKQLQGINQATGPLQSSSYERLHIKAVKSAYIYDNDYVFVLYHHASQMLHGDKTAYVNP